MRLQAPVAISRNAFLFAHFGLFSPLASFFNCGNLYFMISLQITHFLLFAPYRCKIDDFFKYTINLNKSMVYAAPHLYDIQIVLYNALIGIL